MSLSHIGKQITIYGGFFDVVGGVVGNGINILIFSSVHTYRTTPCTFYYLIASICNITFLSVSLIPRLVSASDGIDLSRTSTSWCKMRQFISVSIPLISVSCSCLATIDQFFVTSRSAYLRRLSNIKRVHRIVFIVTIVWLLHGIPLLLFYNISPITNSCADTNYAYTIYIIIYLIGFLCAIPIILMFVFGYLTYRNINLTRALAEQQADRQLTRMILIQVVLVVICFLPYGINNVYNLITSSVSKYTNRLTIESFVTAIITVVSYFYYARSCYMFLISSSRFRRATKDRIFFCLRANQVIPTQQHTIGRTMLEKKTRN